MGNAVEVNPAPQEQPLSRDYFVRQRSPAQTAAARANGRKGGRPRRAPAGPRGTPAKAGLFAEFLVPLDNWRGEGTDFHDLLAGLLEDFRPKKQAELALVEILATELLELRRLHSLWWACADPGAPRMPPNITEPWSVSEHRYETHAANLKILGQIRTAAAGGTAFDAASIGGIRQRRLAKWLDHLVAMDHRELRDLERAARPAERLIPKEGTDGIAENMYNIESADSHVAEAIVAGQERQAKICERYRALGLVDREAWVAVITGARPLDGPQRQLWLEVLEDILSRKHQPKTTYQASFNAVRTWDQEHLRKVLPERVPGLGDIDKGITARQQSIRWTIRQLQELQDQR